METCPLFLRGDIDLANADGLLTTLRSAAGQQSGEVLIDCMDLTFIDVAGLRAVIMAQSELAQQGRDLYLIHPSPFLVHVLEVLDFSCLLRPSLASTRTD